MKRILGFCSFFAFTLPVLLLLAPSLYPFHSYHLPNSLFLEYASNTFVFVFGVGFLSTAFGVSAACSVAFLRFPGRSFIRYMLFLPLAIPSYISALGYTSFLEFSGPLCTFFREVLGLNIHFNIRSIWGGIFVMSVSLYPYVYLITLSRLSSANNFVAIARMCGKSFIQSVKEVLIPISRPAIFAGLAIVVMEVISDFGVSQFFGIQTFAAGIYRAWFLLHDSVHTSRLVLLLLSFVAVAVFFEKRSRRNTNYKEFMSYSFSSTWQLKGLKSFFAFFLLFLLPFFGLIFPIFCLILLSLQSSFDLSILNLVFNSIGVAFVTAVFCVLCAFILIYLKHEKKISKLLFNFSVLGYAIPGLVVGIGIMNFLSYSVSALDFLHNAIFRSTTNFVAVGTFFSLVYSYVFRFLAVGTNSMQSGMERIPKEVKWSLKLMNRGGFSDNLSFYLPMMIRYLISAFVLVFLDTIKELATTLTVRPFNFDTMSTKIYDLVMNERYAEAALPSLVCAGVCLASVALLMNLLYSKKFHRKKYGSKGRCTCDICINNKNGLHC